MLFEIGEAAGFHQPLFAIEMVFGVVVEDVEDAADSVLSLTVLDCLVELVDEIHEQSVIAVDGFDPDAQFLGPRNERHVD